MYKKSLYGEDGVLFHALSGGCVDQRCQHQIQFGSLESLNPLATETIEGVARLATQAEVNAGTDNTTIVTPKKLGLLISAQITCAINTLKTALSPIGIMQLMPFRSTELLAGWYHANGDQYPVSSAVGKALKALPAGYKAD